MKTTNKIHKLSILVMALIATASADAAVPQSINYQGYLTDSAGQAYSGLVDVTFAIYTVPEGGAPLWSNSQGLTMQQGLFSVQLGSDVNPFPVGLFETPLWLGITIASDEEMQPRRALTSVGFAFKAKDADSLQGATAASLDQSSHVEDLANPHATSPELIGAASAGALAVHAGDSSNPHAVSAELLGAATSSELGLHTIAPTAHHDRYSDAEAVSSMGASDDGNTLNHAKYQNTQAVAAVLAADGPGSGLDADQVDGLEATEIINAIATASGTGYVFAGFSTNSILPGGGPLSMNSECKTDFGPLARISWTREVVDSASSNVLTGTAWVRPTITQIECLTTAIRECVYLDYTIPTAITEHRDFDCMQWTFGTSTSISGTIVDGTTMAIAYNQLCTVSRRVACSVPVSP